jgi:hypothetical protein
MAIIHDQALNFSAQPDKRLSNLGECSTRTLDAALLQMLAPKPKPLLIYARRPS